MNTLGRPRHGCGLPDRALKRMSHGRGRGAPCAICGEPITPDEDEYELVFVAGTDPTARTIYETHPPCLSAWETERKTLLGLDEHQPKPTGALPGSAGSE